MVSRVIRDRAGVVLVDVLVATVLLGVALTALISMTGRALASQRQGEQMQAAAMLIEEQLNLVLARGPDSYASRFPVEGSCDAPFGEYRYKLEFTEGQGGDAYRVVATVSWGTGARARSESVETMVAPRLGDEPDPDRRPGQAAVRP